LGDGADPDGAGRAGELTGGADGEPAPLVRGTIVTLREVWRGRTLAVRPVRVVEDVPHRHLAFYLAPGSRWLNDPRDLGEVRFRRDAWELSPEVSDRRVLSFAFADEAYAVLLTWGADERFEGYYVNIQSPLRERDGAFEYTDWFLDARIAPARDAYEWKDEPDLAEAVARGLLGEGDARSIRRAGERAVERVMLREPPFDRDWEAWLPDPTWGPLGLDPGRG
jgi:uncharacterized protein DUF402